jgi:hypothetical protein
MVLQFNPDIILILNEMKLTLKKYLMIFIVNTYI